MSTREIRVSDLSGRPEAATTRIGYKATWYEIDLTASECDALEQELSGYLTAGRRVGKTLQRGRKRVVPEMTRQERADARAWARREGYDIADYGRIPNRILTAYREAKRRQRDPQWGELPTPRM